MNSELLAAIFLLIGSFFMLIAGIGLLRLPDLYLRMSATTKAATFGVGFALLSAATYFGDLGVSTRAVATILFLFLTAPVAAHVLGRAAYMNKVPLWDKTTCDELQGRYNLKSHKLASSDSDVERLSDEADQEEDKNA